MTTVVACPQCRQELKLPEELVGRAVQCPECKHTFTAAVTPAATPAAPGAPPPLPPQTAVSEAPLVDVETDEEEFEKPIDDGAAAPDQPRQRKTGRRSKSGGSYYDELVKTQRRRMKPHRGSMILGLGVVSILFLGPGVFAGAVAYYFGTDDLNEMYSGRMDIKGEGMTKAGRVLGIISLALHVAGLAVSCFCCGLGPIIGVGTS